MAANTSTGTVTGSPLISSDRVEGTKVFDQSGNSIGSVKRLMLEKVSGRVAYAVLSFGGLLGMGGEEHPIPWNQLTYDRSSAVTERDSRSRSFAVHRPRKTASTIGRTDSVKRNCTTTTELSITGKTERISNAAPR